MFTSPKKWHGDPQNSRQLRYESNKRYYDKRNVQRQVTNATQQPTHHDGPSINLRETTIDGSSLFKENTTAVHGETSVSNDMNENPNVNIHEELPTVCAPTSYKEAILVTPSICVDEREKDVPSTLTDDSYNFVYNGLPKTHRELKPRRPCDYCGAKRFAYEFPTFCCMNGKTILAETNIPEELLQLYTSQDDIGKVFRENIRAYNTSFYFTSMGVSLDETLNNMRGGVYTFRAHKGIYHRIDQLVPHDGTPRYLQLYFYDPDTELDLRFRWPNLDRNITKILRSALSANLYTNTFRQMGELGPLDNYRVTLNASSQLDQRVYNKPTTSEVAGIWVEGNNNITAYKRSIVIYGKSDNPQTIQAHYSCYDPQSYPLFFPYGEFGWHLDIPRRGVTHVDESTNEDTIDDDTGESETGASRKTVAMREYYSYKLQIRPTINILLLGGRLLQQFTVDVYIKIETSRLQYYERNQTKIRADLYQGIVDCVNAGDVIPNKIGKRIVLPASFIGGLRDMRRRFLDAMTLVHDDGKPDFFLTMTCNPNWPDIQENLSTGQLPQHRPDLVSRVFRAKLEQLKDLLLKKNILGEVKSHVYVIEFQKRGLPHAHFLLIMHASHKINSPDEYDKFVCAEIPNKDTHPTLHDVVIKHMIHGPCGVLRPTSPCMEGNLKICRFRYPRQFNEQTSQGEDAYPLYRRRNNGIPATVRGKTLDNRWVVPYNPKLLMLFNCHINLEICSSIKSVKYLFKYIYKGHDKQVIQIDHDNDIAVINERKRFQDARYISPPEATWRIFKFSLSQIQPPVLALQLHLPNNHNVTFKENAIMSDVVNKERNKKTMLTAFFEVNRLHPTARQYLYKDFSTHYTWNKTSRCRVERTLRPQKGRIVSTNPVEGERYYLRILLTHLRGPTSFEDLRRVGAITHPTFRKAALERGLLENDNSLSQCLQEASTFQFPHALRRLFATILVFCEPSDVLKLWVEHFESLSEDFQHQCKNVVQVQNVVLQEIRSYIHPMGKTLSDFDLPNISDDVNLLDLTHRDTQEELNIIVDPNHVQAKDTVNLDQKKFYDEIMNHVNLDLPGVLFIDGPGGTGKTFLYKALLAEVRSRGQIALATASSGVAANNMPGGRTAHSRFKIPINLTNNSICGIKKQSGLARLINSSKLIIWDEASMANDNP